MADSYIQVAPDSSGKKVQTYENTVGGQTVEAQAVVLVDSSGNPITKIASTTNLLQGDGAGNAESSIVAQNAPYGIKFQIDQNDYTFFSIINASNTDTAVAGYGADSDTSGFLLASYATNFGPSGGINGNDVALTAESGPLVLQATSVIRFMNDSNNDTAKFDHRTIASGASATWDEVNFPGITTTVTGTTQITTAKGFNKFSLYKSTITDSSAVTIDRGATLYIEAAPLAAGSVTLTNPYALWVDDGVTRLDGNLVLTGTGGTNHVLKQASAGAAITSGAVTFAEIAAGTTAATMTLGENTSIALDPAGSADGKYSGITVAGTGGATIAFGDLVTLDKDDSRWELVDISVAAAATGDARGILGMAVTSSSDGAALTVLLHGIIRADANFPALTIGAPVYASTTGDVVVAQPTTTDYVIRIIGYGLTADEMYFNPDCGWITHT